MRKVRIAAVQGPRDNVAIEKPITVEKNIEWTVERIRQVMDYHPEIVCLAETFSTTRIDGKTTDRAEDASGPTLRTMRKLARELNVAIICPLYERRKGRIFNTAVVINKTGRIVGRYDKIHPMESEIDDGVMPGKTAPTVINLDGIKIGCQICFDANWPQDWLNLKEAGAQLIFFCSAFSAGNLLTGLSTVLAVPVVASTLCRHCRIYDRTGRMIAHQTPYFDYAMTDVWIDQPLFHLDDQWEHLDHVRKQWPQITTEVFDGDGRWTIGGSHDPQVLKKVIDRYKIVDVDAYLARALKKQNQTRKDNG